MMLRSTSCLLALFCLLSAVLFVSALPTSWDKLTPEYSFETYEREYNKIYANAEEREMRRAYFQESLDEVLRHNKDETKSWKLGINHLSDRSNEEFRRLLGYRMDIAASRKAKANHKPVDRSYLASNEDVPELPASIDWRLAGIVTAVKDQGACGSCWTFGTAETIESYWALKTGYLTALSEQQILDCTPNPNDCGGTGGCGGGTPEIAYDQIIKQGGLASEWTYPYVSHFGDGFSCHFNKSRTVPMARLSGYTVLPTNQYLPVLQHVGTVGPLAINVDASSWKHYATGVFDGCNQTNPDIDHVVQLVGYGSDPQHGDYWLVRNSWTPVWGDKGYIKLRRTESVRCGIDLTPSDGTGCNGGPSKVTVCGTCGILFDTSYPHIQV